MKILANYPVTTRTIADLEEGEQFDFKKRYGGDRTYRATRVFVEWVNDGGTWMPSRVEWSGPMITKSGRLSDGVGGSDQTTFGFTGAGGVCGEVAEAMTKMLAHLPSVERRP